MEQFIVGAELTFREGEGERERERERERCRACAEQGDARNRNRCFRTLILKLVNPLESLEDRIEIHI